MASLVKRGKVYYVAWRDNGVQRRKSLGTGQRVEAEKRLRVWNQRLAEDKWSPPADNPTVESFLKRWKPWAATNLKPKTRECELQRFTDFMAWSNSPRLGDASRQDVQRFVQHLLDTGRSKLTANNYVRDIQAVFTHSMKHFEMFSGPNPAKGVRRLKLEERPPHYLEKVEIARLLDAARRYDSQNDSHMEWFFALGIYVGLRLDEIGNAQWGWFDWTAKLLVIPGDKSFTLKSHKSRSIPLSAKLVDILHPGAKNTGYLFEVDYVNTGHYRFNPRKSFRTICKSAGLDTITRWDIEKRVTPHLLRHTFGTQHAKAGVSIYKICEWLGHSDVKVTMRYAHVQGYDKDIDSF